VSDNSAVSTVKRQEAILASSTLPITGRSRSPMKTGATPIASKLREATLMIATLGHAVTSSVFGAPQRQTPQ